MNAKRALRLLLLCAVVIAAGVVGVSSATAKTIVGTASNDTLRGTPAADVIYGKAGNDTIYGLGGNDRIVGGPGADKIFCGSGRDTAIADKQDRVAKDCEVVKGLATTPPLPPKPKPLCQGQPATIVGTPYSDTLTGTPGDDIIAGLDGDDRIDGGGGNDIICGDEGNDRLSGGDGSDTVDSGSGTDVCIGGEAGENCSAPATFQFDSGVPADQQNEIQDGFALVDRYLIENAHLSLDGFTVFVDEGYDASHAGGERITLHMGQWSSTKSFAHGSRIELFAHEHFHLVQEALSRGKWPPSWMIEGSADFIGYTTALWAGVLSDPAGEKQSKLNQAKREGMVLTAPGCQILGIDVCPYVLGQFAVEYLVGRTSLGALIAFWKDLGDTLSFETAFRNAFGLDTATFYSQFEAYWQTL